MYTVSVSSRFVAQHVLTVPDPGPEGELHSHHFGVEVRVRGLELGASGYLLDIDVLTTALERTVADFRDETLNDLPEFEGLNPSVEHLSRVFGDRLLESLDSLGTDLERLETLEVSIDEDDVARVTHERGL